TRAGPVRGRATPRARRPASRGSPRAARRATTPVRVGPARAVPKYRPLTESFIDRRERPGRPDGGDLVQPGGELQASPGRSVRLPERHPGSARILTRDAAWLRSGCSGRSAIPAPWAISNGYSESTEQESANQGSSQLRQPEHGDREGHVEEQLGWAEGLAGGL